MLQLPQLWFIESKRDFNINVKSNNCQQTFKKSSFTTASGTDDQTQSLLAFIDRVLIRFTIQQRLKNISLFEREKAYLLNDADMSERDRERFEGFATPIICRNYQNRLSFIQKKKKK